MLILEIEEANVVVKISKTIKLNQSNEDHVLKSQKF